MLKIEDYAFSFGLCFSRQIMLKIMLAYCINAYLRVCVLLQKISIVGKGPSVVTGIFSETFAFVGGWVKQHFVFENTDR